MVQKLVIYPDDRVNCTSTDVRTFNETLFNVIQDMRDTMEANHIEAMSAMQIAYPYNIILIKEDDGYHEYINPRILTNSDLFDSIESSIYYPEVEVTVERYAKIKLIYEDRTGKQQHADIQDASLAATLQRKIDYTFGGNLLDRVDQNRREKILESLAGRGLMPQVDDVCPTFSKKDYFVSFTDKLLGLMGISLLSPLFGFKEETLQTIYSLDKFLFPFIVVLMISFFFYAQYEAKKYSSCSSCQIGNNIGVIIKRIGIGTILAITSYFIFS
jgi:peptide deformylase